MLCGGPATIPNEQPAVRPPLSSHEVVRAVLVHFVHGRAVQSFLPGKSHRPTEVAHVQPPKLVEFTLKFLWNSLEHAPTVGNRRCPSGLWDLLTEEKNRLGPARNVGVLVVYKYPLRRGVFGGRENVPCNMRARRRGLAIGDPIAGGDALADLFELEGVRNQESAKQDPSGRTQLPSEFLSSIGNESKERL